MVERILSDYQQAHEISAIALRYFNAQRSRSRRANSASCAIPRPTSISQGDDGDPGLYPGFCRVGTDYPTSDGTAIRDYIHVSDLAEAHVAAVRRLLAGEKGGAFNLGTGRGYSVKQVLDAIATETGESLTVSNAPRRPGDPPVLVADASLSHTELGFAPQLSDLTSIVKTAWAWHRQAHPQLATTKERAAG